MSTPGHQVTEQAMLAQLFADFTDGLSSARLEHALARLLHQRDGRVPLNDPHADNKENV